MVSLPPLTAGNKTASPAPPPAPPLPSTVRLITLPTSSTVHLAAESAVVPRQQVVVSVSLGVQAPLQPVGPLPLLVLVPHGLAPPRPAGLHLARRRSEQELLELNRLRSKKGDVGSDMSSSEQIRIRELIPVCPEVYISNFYALIFNKKCAYI